MKPKLDPEALAYLDRLGLETVRTGMLYGRLKPEGIMFIRGDTIITQADVETWVTWKAGQNARIMKVTVWASIIAAVASIIGVVVGVLAWLKPLGGPPGH